MSADERLATKTMIKHSYKDCVSFQEGSPPCPDCAMKMVPCGNPSCGQHRVHYTRQDEMRSHRTVSVSEDYMGKTFCSITCACEAGYYSVKSGWIKDPKEG